MYKILALNCLISAYAMSVQYLDGIKYGDYQVTITGMLMSVCFLCISRAKVSYCPFITSRGMIDPVNSFLVARGKIVTRTSTWKYLQPLCLLVDYNTVRDPYRIDDLHHQLIQVAGRVSGLTISLV